MMETYQILLNRFAMESVVDDWLHQGFRCDLRLRQAKTPGHFVMETTDALFAARVKEHHPAVKIHIKNN